MHGPFHSTGGFFNVPKVICLWESLKIQNMSWDWCFHFTEIGPFWDLVSKKIIAEISKIHWKSMIKKHQYCFANISATKARIFMKFHMVLNYYLVCLYFKFYKDLCINKRARVVNARGHVLSRLRAFTNPARASMHESQDSNWPPHKISWRSELLLRRYLQNNTGVF